MKKINEEKRSKEEITKEKLKIQKARSAKKEKIDDKKFYVQNKDLLAELYKWRDSAEKVEDRVISEELGRMILTIATKMTNHSSFKYYNQDTKSEMISYACFKCVQGLKNYNFEFKNPFAYISMAVWNACVSVCANYYKQINLKKDMIKKMLSQIECTPGIDRNKIINTYIKQYIDDGMGDDEGNGEYED